MTDKQKTGIAPIAFGVFLFLFPIVLVAAGFGAVAWSIGWLFQLAAAPALVIFGLGRIVFKRT
jgi:hypothetical protein